MSKNLDRSKDLSKLDITKFEPVSGNQTLTAIFKGLLNERDGVTGKRERTKAVFLDCDTGKHVWFHPYGEKFSYVMDCGYLQVGKVVKFTWSSVYVERVTHHLGDFKITIE